jgi:hypothetical protein
MGDTASNKDGGDIGGGDTLTPSMIAFKPSTEGFRLEPKNVPATKYNPDLALRILEAHASGSSLVKVAKVLGIHHQTILRWGAIYPDFGRALKEARVAAGHASDEAALEVLQKPLETKVDLGRAREVANHFRWRSERYAPDDYGRQIALNVAGSLDLQHSLRAEAPAWLGPILEGTAEPQPQPDQAASPTGGVDPNPFDT